MQEAATPQPRAILQQIEQDGLTMQAHSSCAEGGKKTVINNQAAISCSSLNLGNVLSVQQLKSLHILKHLLRYLVSKERNAINHIIHHPAFVLAQAHQLNVSTFCLKRQLFCKHLDIRMLRNLRVFFKKLTPIFVPLQKICLTFDSFQKMSS